MAWAIPTASARRLQRLGFQSVITADKEEILRADGAILPGVGAFGDAMACLRETGMDEAARAYAASGKPLLGICLGMQLLFTEGEEYGIHQGLDLLPGRIIRFQGEYKIPHMGWNRLQFRQGSPLLEGLDEGYVYFVHSYHALPEQQEHLIAVADYYQPVTAIVGRAHIFGMQFHPEKSGELGMSLLRNFLKLTTKSVA